MSDEALEAKERGNAAYKKRDFAAAHGHYDEAIRLSPREITFYSNKGAAFLEEGKYEDCIATCLKAVDIGLEIKAQTAKAMARTGTAYAKLGNASEALVWYEKSLAEVHNEDVAKKVAEMTEILQNKTVKDDDSKNAPGKDSPASAPSQKLLSSTYVSGIFEPLLRLADTEKNAQLCKNVVYSSPEIMTAFLNFMNDISVLPYENYIAMEKQFTNVAFAKKNWNSFTWISPFVRLLTILTPIPSYAFTIMKNAQFLNQFEYVSYEPPSKAVLSFVRSRMPHLVWLAGLHQFFREIPIGSNKVFNCTGITFIENNINDFLTIFAVKRFGTRSLELIHRNIVGCGFAKPFHLSEVMNFFENSDLRMPETEYVHIMLQVDDNFVPITRFVKALRSVFTRFRKTDINILFRNELRSAYNYGKLEKAYQHCRRELATLSDDFCINFSVTEHVVYRDSDFMYQECLRRHKLPNFEFNESWTSDSYPLFAPCSAYINRDKNIGKTASFHYELQFSNVSDAFDF